MTNTTCSISCKVLPQILSQICDTSEILNIIETILETNYNQDTSNPSQSARFLEEGLDPLTRCCVAPDEEVFPLFKIALGLTPSFGATPEELEFLESYIVALNELSNVEDSILPAFTAELTSINATTMSFVTESLSGRFLTAADVPYWAKWKLTANFNCSATLDNGFGIVCPTGQSRYLFSFDWDFNFKFYVDDTLVGLELTNTPFVGDPVNFLLGSIVRNGTTNEIACGTYNTETNSILPQPICKFSDITVCDGNGIFDQTENYSITACSLASMSSEPVVPQNISVHVTDSRLHCCKNYDGVRFDKFWVNPDFSQYLAPGNDHFPNLMASYLNALQILEDGESNNQYEADLTWIGEYGQRTFYSESDLKIISYTDEFDNSYTYYAKYRLQATYACEVELNTNFMLAQCPLGQQLWQLKNNWSFTFTFYAHLPFPGQLPFEGNISNYRVGQIARNGTEIWPNKHCAVLEHGVLNPKPVCGSIFDVDPLIPNPNCPSGTGIFDLTKSSAIKPCWISAGLDWTPIPSVDFPGDNDDNPFEFLKLK